MARTEYFDDSECLGCLASDLTSGPAKRDQGMVARIKAAFGGNAAHSLSHLFNGDGDEPFGSGLGTGKAHGQGEFGEADAGSADVQRGLAVWAEDGGKVIGVQTAQDQIGIGDGGGAAPAIGGRAGVSTSTLRATSGAEPVEGEDRAAARRDCFDVQHRTSELYAGHLGGIAPFKLASISAHIGGGTAHIKTEHGLSGGLGCCLSDADHTSGRAGHDSISAAKRLRTDQTPGRGHEEQRRAGCRLSYPFDIGAQDRGQIGIGDRRFGAGNEAW